MNTRSLLKRVMSVVGIAAMAMFLPVSPVSAQTLNLGGSSVTAGNNLSLSGHCTVVSGGNNTVNIMLTSSGGSSSLGTLTTDASGNFQGTFSVPENLSGASTITATCLSDASVVTSALQINAAADADVDENITPSINLGSANLTAGGTVSVSGVCTPNQTVSFTLNQGGTLTSLGSVSAGSSGSFSANLTLPQALAPGSSTITATCSSGATTSVNFTVPVSASVDSVGLTFSDTNLVPGELVMVSGECGSASAGGTVTFALVQNGQSQPIQGAATVITNRGAFDAEVRIPTTIANGSATIVAICPNTGATINGGVVLAGATTPPASTTGSTTTQGNVIISSNNMVEGMGGGTDTGYTMPMGGVNAGVPEEGLSAGYLALGLTLVAAAAFAGRKLALKQ